MVVYGLNDQFEAGLAAFEKLVGCGWKNVAVLAGGIDAWKRAGLSVSSDRQRVPLPTGKFQADADKSVVRWVGRNLVNQLDGTAGLSEATIELHDGRLAGGKAVVDMNSIICQDIEDSKLAKVLIDHLITDDFFLVDRFPTATFVLDSAQTIENATPGSPNYQIEGTMTLRGLSAKIQFPALLGFSETSIALQAQFDFNRVSWDSKYGFGHVYEALGQQLVNDFISISFQLIAPL